MKSAPAIAFEYRPSRWLTAAIVAVAAAGLLALALCAMPLWMKIPVALAACAYLVHCLRPFRRDSICRAAWYDAGHWRLNDGTGVEHLADLETGMVRGNWIVLRLRRHDGRRAALILGPDNSGAELRRRLRVRLARARDAAG